MTIVYDNWERLVAAAMKRNELRRLAYAASITTAGSSFSYSSVAPSEAPHLPCVQGCSFGKSIELAYGVIRGADDATSLKLECLELKFKAQKLVGLLHQAARVSHQLYCRPTQRVIDFTEEVLDRAVNLVQKCQGVKRFFTIVNTVDLQKVSMQLLDSIKNVSWLIRGHEYLLLPPLALEEPTLYRIWEPIATLYMGSDDEQCDAIESLVCWARDEDLYKQLIIEEGGLEPILRLLLKEGKLEARENALKLIRLVGNVKQLIDSGVCYALARILEQSPTELQRNVVVALFELTSNGGVLEHHFKPHDIIGLLVSHLESENHSKYDDDYTIEMAVGTIWHLVNVDSNVYHSITKLRTLSCFANLLEKGPKVAQYYCAMTLMEVTAAAERDEDLRTRSGFKLNSPACKAILDQLYRIISDSANHELLVLCIKTIGNLATTISASEKGMIRPLVKLLEEPQEGEVYREVCVALTKYVAPDLFLSVNRSKAVIGAGGVKHLVILVYTGEQIVQSLALKLLYFVAQNVPHHAQFAEAGVLAMLEWASRQPLFIQDEDLRKLLMEIKSTLERHQSRACKETY